MLCKPRIKQKLELGFLLRSKDFWGKVSGEVVLNSGSE